jgi:phage repressor protein C with HTH and peptisase S24 domain
MQLKDKINELKIKTLQKISYEDVAKILGLGSKQAVYNRITRKQELQPYEEAALDEYFYNKKVNNINQNSFPESTSNNYSLTDRIEIDYWEGLPEDLKNPNIMSVWFDREIIENAWGMKADHLCIIPMIGDKMTHYWYPIRNNDILIIDMSHNYIMGNGVYFAVSRNNTRFWIREMQILINNDIQIKGFAPSGETTKVISADTLKEADFKIIGKVIKNVSFRL